LPAGNMRPKTMQQSSVGRNAVKVSSGYGRLYVTGPAYRKAYRLPGATLNERRGAIELSLTLESLRGLRKEMGVQPEEFARFCTPEVMSWAMAAGRSERFLKDLHKRLEDGWRADLPWEDASGKNRDAYDHQKVMASVAISLDGSAFLCEMGTGKTRAAVEAIRYKLENDELDVAVVVCPKPVMRTWENEFKLWAPHIPVEVLRGTVKERGRRLDEWKKVPFQPRVVVMNTDVLYLLKSALERLAGKARVGVVLDEMHRIKNPQAKVSKAAMELAAKVEWRLGMTGTPVLQGIQDVWGQWYVVDLGITFGANYVQYRREFLDEDPYLMKLTAKPGALEEVGNRMRKRGLRYTKQDCMDLPPKTYEIMEVEMTSDQRRAYREMEAELIALLTGEGATDPADEDRYATASNQLAAILRLTQITSGFIPDENGLIHRFQPNPKLATLKELVEEQIGSQKIIVWARYSEDVASIAEAFQDMMPLIVVGQGGEQKVRERGVQFPPRDEVEERFQMPAHRLLIANPAAGGVGLNLQPASLAIYYSQGYSLEHRLQSEDRCHRGGSEVHNKVTYVDLVAKDTVDVVVADALSGKKEVADVVVDLRRALGVDDE
jgi:SNF2 family DNA or RNA helicase